jgi:CheY-like chemotaxis protein
MATSTHQAFQATSVLSSAARCAVLASSDLSFRQRVRDTLTGLRWQVREASGGAEALAHLEAYPAEALILDSWLPDLEIREFVKEFERRHPLVDLITLDTAAETGAQGSVRSPRRNELLHALRSGQDGAASAGAGSPGQRTASV